MRVRDATPPRGATRRGCRDGGGARTAGVRGRRGCGDGGQGCEGRILFDVLNTHRSAELASISGSSTSTWCVRRRPVTKLSYIGFAILYLSWRVSAGSAGHGSHDAGRRGGGRVRGSDGMPGGCAVGSGGVEVMWGAESEVQKGV